MTEEQKTKLAMESAKNTNSKKPVQKPQPITSKLKDNQVEIANGVTVTLAEWTGKTKKKFKKEFKYAESMEDVDFTKILEILVYSSVKEDILFTDKELQYLLTKLRIMSISDDFKGNIDCPNCTGSNEIKTSITDSIHFTKSNLPTKYEDFTFSLVKKTTFDELLENTKENDIEDITNEKDVEMACRVIKNNKTPKEMLEILEDMSLKKLSPLMKEFNKNLSTYRLYTKQECKHCRKDQEFELEIITGIFETLAE